MYVAHPRHLPEKTLLEIEETMELFELELPLFCLLVAGTPGEGDE